MNYSWIKDVGTFGLALLVGIGGWLRIDAIDNKLQNMESKIDRLEIRMSNVVTKTNERIPSNLSVDLESEIEVIKTDIEWIKKFITYINKKQNES